MKAWGLAAACGGQAPAHWLDYAATLFLMDPHAPHGEQIFVTQFSLSVFSVGAFALMACGMSASRHLHGSTSARAL